MTTFIDYVYTTITILLILLTINVYHFIICCQGNKKCLIMGFSSFGSNLKYLCLKMEVKPNTTVALTIYINMVIWICTHCVFVSVTIHVDLQLCILIQVWFYEFMRQFRSCTQIIEGNKIWVCPMRLTILSVRRPGGTDPCWKMSCEKLNNCSSYIATGFL